MYSLSVPKENSSEEKLNTTAVIERLMDTYGNDVLRTAYLYLKDIQKAEDAFQEVFIKVYHKYDSFNGGSSEKTWLIRITINVCKDMLRSSWLRRILLTDRFRPQQFDLDIEKKVIQREEDRILFNEVLSLRSVFKEVILLYYYHEFDTVEISQILNISEGTVRSRLHRARNSLKNKLGGRIDFSE